MLDNINAQFDVWKNREHAEGQTAGLSSDDRPVSDPSFDDQQSQDIEQVSIDIFGNRDLPSEEQADQNITVAEAAEPAEQKASFTELRHKRKIPRLKKTMVLAIITGTIFVFLFIVNVFMQKNNEKRKYLNEQDNTVSVGHNFSLGDMERKPRQIENIEDDEIILWKSPPTYEPMPEYKNAALQPVQLNSAVYSTPGDFTENDLLAMKAQIGKEGGYGLAHNAVSYNSAANGAMNLPAANIATEQFPTRQEYTQQRLNEIAQYTQMAGGAVGDRQTNTDRLNTGRYTEAGMYNPINTQAGSDIAYLHDNCLFPGTVIHAILVSRIDTDYPGPIHARVTENIYDSKTGKNLLIPQGTILQGNYSSSSIGVAKVQIAWESMVVNYAGVAYQVSLGGMAGIDKRGQAGIAGSLDDHYFEWLKAAGIVSLFTMLNSEIAYQTREQSNTQIRELIDVNQGIINQFGGRIIDRALNIQPTVRVANGTAISVSVNAPVSLRPFPAVKAEEKYVRKK